LKRNAKNLLKEFDKRANELTWNSEGVIFIDQVGIPGSNMFKIYPLLFTKTTKTHNLTGLEDLRAKIQEMGLGDYLTKKTIQQFSGSGRQSTKKSTLKANLSSDAWWYIGP
jgi:hypothetical protein